MSGPIQAICIVLGLTPYLQKIQRANPAIFAISLGTAQKSD
jgi:hypothetical protein